MNSEQLIIRAGKAIELYRQHHDNTCYLEVANGIVLALPLSKASTKPNQTLTISPFQQSHGCTSSKWNSIGTSLFNKYTKEIACQAHQKH